MSAISKEKKESIVIGVFFIVAAVSSIIGLSLYAPVLQNPHFVLEAHNSYHQVMLGALMELVLVCTAMGTAIVMYRFLLQYHPGFALGYFTFRLLEVVFILVGMLAVLMALTCSQQYAEGNFSDLNTYQRIGNMFIAIHKWAFMLGPNFMLSINTALYSWVFYKTGLAPQWLSVWGILASILILLAAQLELFGIIDQLSLYGILLAMPIAFFEMTLAVWLIIKGFTTQNQTL